MNKIKQLDHTEWIKMIKETTIELTVNLMNYENLKMSATGDNIEELREYLIDQLNNFGTMDEVVRGCIDSYVKRVLSKPEPVREETRDNTREEITCDNCEAKGTELCNTCPYNEDSNTVDLNTLTNDSGKTNPKPEIESGQSEGTEFRKASEIKAVTAKPKGEESGLTNVMFKDESKLTNSEPKPEPVQNPYDNGMPKATHCTCGAPLTITDLRLSDLLGIEPCCKECRDKIRGKEE